MCNEDFVCSGDDGLAPAGVLGTFYSCGNTQTMLQIICCSCRYYHLDKVSSTTVPHPGRFPLPLPFSWLMSFVTVGIQVSQLDQKLLWAELDEEQSGSAVSLNNGAMLIQQHAFQFPEVCSGVAEPEVEFNSFATTAALLIWCWSAVLIQDIDIIVPLSIYHWANNIVSLLLEEKQQRIPYTGYWLANFVFAWKIVIRSQKGKVFIFTWTPKI